MTETAAPTVLYVEDDPDYRAATRMQLEAGGFRVREASTGEEGLDLFRQERPDVVLVDLMMEEVDAGTQFVKELRADGERVPIFLLSSLGDSLVGATDYRAMGLAGVLQKPIKGETLVAVLRARLEVEAAPPPEP